MAFMVTLRRISSGGLKQGCYLKDHGNLVTRGINNIALLTKSPDPSSSLRPEAPGRTSPP